MTQQTNNFENLRSGDNRWITLAIHTYDYALALKNLLEREGVKAVMQNVNLDRPEVSVGMRVRISVADLPLALRIIENTDIFTHKPEIPDAAAPTGRMSHPILVPVDFSQHSLRVCDIAFQMAERLRSAVVLLNSFITPTESVGRQLGDTLNFDTPDTEVNILLARDAKSKMDRLAAELRQKIKLGQLPPVKFTSVIAEGIPEEVILETARQQFPELIVMGTRAADKKERELIGSVTAEVLDSSRFPILAIPELVDMNDARNISHVLLLCSLDQNDMIAVDALYRFFNRENLLVELAWIPPKKQIRNKQADTAQKMLKEYCEAHYPRFSFCTRVFNMPSMIDDFSAVEKERHIDLIALPNKKKSMFSRLFNPSLAHRLLFHADIPMMVIPV